MGEVLELRAETVEPLQRNGVCGSPGVTTLAVNDPGCNFSRSPRKKDRKA